MKSMKFMKFALDISGKIHHNKKTFNTIYFIESVYFNGFAFAWFRQDFPQ